MPAPNSFPSCGRGTPAWFIPVIAILAATGTPSRHHSPPAAEAAPAIRALSVGDTLPALIGRDLTGRDTSVPRDSRGRVAFLALGFTYRSRLQVEAWAERFRKEHGGASGVTFYEVPVMGGSARLARPFIESGMKKGTPAELHGHVITVWQDAGEWKKRMGYSASEAAYCVLVDRDGIVRWLHAGPLDDAAWAELGHALAAVR